MSLLSVQFIAQFWFKVVTDFGRWRYLALGNAGKAQGKVSAS
jgi:hypothetical protein